MKLLYIKSSNNFGDMLSPIVVQYMIDKYKANNLSTEHIEATVHGKLLAVGSILSKAKEEDVVWGSGLIRNNPFSPPNNVKILAVRGPKTKDIIQCNCPSIFGDPALLIPQIYNKPVKKQYKVGVIPHFVDYHLFKHVTADSIKVINICDNPYKIIDQLRACDVVISTSLHGIIVSEAYDIPAVWLRVSDNVIGGNFKFNDYFLATGRSERVPVLVTKTIHNLDIFNLAKHTLPLPMIDTNPLEQAFANYFGDK